jgi:hypothetical protein
MLTDDQRMTIGRPCSSCNDIDASLSVHFAAFIPATNSAIKNYHVRQLEEGG